VASNIEKAISKTLRKSSPARAWGILFFCVCIVAFAVFLRFFVLSVWYFEGERVFVCELALCKQKARTGDLLLASTGGGNTHLLWLIGKSGDSISIPTPFDTLGFYIPKEGDTIKLETLNPMLWDAAASLYKSIAEEKTRTEISLWSLEKELPFSYVGKAVISGRPVSEREVAFLPWQELRLLEFQLQRIFPAIDSVHFRRKLFVDTLEIESFVVDEELFYLSCEKPERQKICYDSREKGFFRKREISGRAI
jgi:hypothetical protein